MKGWKRIDGRGGVTCPVCGHKAGCMLSPEGEAAICLRVEQGSTKAVKGGMGWVHKLKGDDRKRAEKLPSAKEPPKVTRAQWERLIKSSRLPLRSPKLIREASRLGVTPQSLYDLRIGHIDGSFTFPMFDGELRPIGIRKRNSETAEKICVPGSQNGLFVPETYDPSLVPCFDNPKSHAATMTPAWLVLIPEGPTDVAAALSIGVRSIGRPNNRAGAELLARLLFGTLAEPATVQHVIIMADRDATKHLRSGEPHWPGWEGALAVATHLLDRMAGLPAEHPWTYGRATLRVCYPPGQHKDLRDWFKAANGSGLQVLLDAIEAAKAIDFNWLARERAALRKRKETERRAVAA